jgi:hypothetical protein
MGMALAQDKASLEAAAIGFCGKFWQQKVSRLGGNWLGGVPEFYPDRMDENFCETVCLADTKKKPTKASRDRFRRSCGVVIAMDVWRRFAAYGRNQRIS